MVLLTPVSTRSVTLFPFMTLFRSPRVGAVPHLVGLAVGAGDGTRIQIIAADHDRRLQLAAAYHFVERQAEAMAVAEADPADARRQALKGDALAGHVEPAVQVRVVGNQLLDLDKIGRAHV